MFCSQFYCLVSAPLKEIINMIDNTVRTKASLASNTIQRPTLS